MNKIISLVLNKHIWIIPSLYSMRALVTRNHNRLIFLDLDGTIWEDKGSGGILKTKFLNTNFTTNTKLKMRVVFFTNQTLFSRDCHVNVKVFFNYVIAWLGLIRKLRPVAILVCHHHPKANLGDLRLDCPFRKPSNRMIAELNKIIPVDVSKSFLVGDKITDMIAGMRSNLHVNLLIYNQNMFELNESSNNLEDDFAVFRIVANRQVENVFEQLSSDV